MKPSRKWVMEMGSMPCTMKKERVLTFFLVHDLREKRKKKGKEKKKRPRYTRDSWPVW
jgi:hypothetical protein